MAPAAPAATVDQAAARRERARAAAQRTLEQTRRAAEQAQAILEQTQGLAASRQQAAQEAHQRAEQLTAVAQDLADQAAAAATAAEAARQTAEGADRDADEVADRVRVAEQAACWRFDNEGQRWTLTVCKPELVTKNEIPEHVQGLAPDAKYRVGLSLEPSAAPETGYAFMDEVMATIAAASRGVYFDSFTAELHLLI